MSGHGLIKSIKQYTYIQEDLLGKGSTGEVYLGVDNQRNQKVAIKIINMREITNEVTQYLLENQKKALSSVKHPNVLHAYDIIQQKDYCYIVTEYCNGGTLHQEIWKKGRFNQGEALTVFKAIVAGYKQLAALGIVHRDLKPANILLNDGVPKISDFGYCECKGIPKPSVYYNVGSPSYMSPEAYLNNLYSEKSDIWALGILAFEMVTGHTIDQGAKLMDSVHRMSREGIPFPSGLSNNYRNIVSACLNLDTNQRINTDGLISLLQKTQHTIVRKELPIQDLKQSKNLPQTQVNPAPYFTPTPQTFKQTVEVVPKAQTSAPKLITQTQAPPVVVVNQTISTKSSTAFRQAPNPMKASQNFTTIVPAPTLASQPVVFSRPASQYFYPPPHIVSVQPAISQSLPTRPLMSQSLHFGDVVNRPVRDLTGIIKPIRTLNTINDKFARSQIFMEPPEEHLHFRPVTTPQRQFFAHHRTPPPSLPQPVFVNQTPIQQQVLQASFKKRQYIAPVVNPEVITAPTPSLIKPNRFAQQTTRVHVPTQNNMPVISFTHNPVQTNKKPLGFPTPVLVAQKPVSRGVYNMATR